MLKECQVMNNDYFYYREMQGLRYEGGGGGRSTWLLLRQSAWGLTCGVSSWSQRLLSIRLLHLEAPMRFHEATNPELTGKGHPSHPAAAARTRVSHAWGGGIEVQVPPPSWARLSVKHVLEKDPPKAVMSCES